MKLFLAFSGEGTTDHRFMPTIIERLIQQYLFEKGIPAEFDWIIIPKKDTSHNNILKMCSDAKDHHLVFFHRDSGNVSWEQAYQNHFATAVIAIDDDETDTLNKNLIPVIPVTETEAWMLYDKELLKLKIETNLSNQELGLTYRVNHIEEIADPKSVIETAIHNHNQTLNRKQRKYAVKIGDLYDSIASEISLSDLENLDSFKRFKTKLYEVLDSFIE